MKTKQTLLAALGSIAIILLIAMSVSSAYAQVTGSIVNGNKYSCDDNRRDLNRCIDAYKGCTANNNDLRDDIEFLQNELDAMTCDCPDVEGELDAAKAELAEKNVIIVALEAKTAALEAEKSALMAIIVNLSSNSTARDELDVSIEGTLYSADRRLKTLARKLKRKSKRLFKKATKARGDVINISDQITHFQASSE